MNWNSLRSIFDIIAVVNAGLIAALLGFGCTDTGTKVSCDAALGVPVSWTPILALVATAATFARMIIKGLTGAGGLFGKEAAVAKALLFVVVCYWLIAKTLLG
jgi:hypothetical protein